MYVRRAGDAASAARSRLIEDERRGLVAELDLEQLDRVDLVHDLAPAVVRVQVGHEAAGVDRRAGAIRSGEAEPAVSASARQRLRRRASSAPLRRRHAAVAVRRAEASTISGSGPAGSGAGSAAARCA